MFDARLKHLLATTLTLAALAVVSACQRQGDPASDRSTPLPTLSRGLGAEPETLDPRLAEDNASLAIALELHEGLTRLAPDGSVVPGAASRWSVTTDGQQYTFHLRDGLRWSDGSALEARHFVAGLESLRQPQTTAPYAGLYEALRDVRAIDAHEVRIVLNRPVPYLPALLALPAASPQHDQDVAADVSPTNGPFLLRSRTPGESLVLERNPHYWDAATVRIGVVRYLTVTDLTTELNLYRTGEIDITSEVPNAQLDQLRRTLASQLRIAPYLAVYGYAVNLKRLDDRDARLALSLAVDRDRLTRLVTGAGETPAYSWIPDRMPAYTPARLAWADESRDTTIADARKRWSAARARAAAPAAITLCTDSSANHRRTAVALADFWRSALGIETKIVELEWSVYLTVRSAPGDCDLVRFGWSADYVDPEAFLAMFETGHAQNVLGYSSATYDQWLRASRTAATAAERASLLAKAEGTLLDDAIVIPLFFRVSKRLVQPYVQGVQDNPLGQLPSRDLVVQPH